MAARFALALGLSHTVTTAVTPAAPPACTFAPAAPPALDAAAFLAFLRAQAPACAELALAPGTYTVAAPAPGARGHVEISGLSNVVVAMADVRLVLAARASTAMYLTALTNVTLAGPLELVGAELPTNQARITAIAPDGHSFDVVVPDLYPLEDWAGNRSFACNVFDPLTRWWKPGTWDIYHDALEPLGGGGRAFRMTFSQDYGPSGENVAVGDLVGCRGADFAFTFFVDGCENSTFADVTLLGGPGFGFFSGGRNVPGSRGGNRYVRPKILRPPAPAGASEAPLLSLSADGFHSAGVPWGPQIDGAHFEGFADDGIAIHGTFDIIAQAVPGSGGTSGDGDGQIWVTSAGSYDVGDELRIYNKTFGPAALRAVIVAAADAAEGFAPPANVSHTMPGRSLLPGTRFVVLNVSFPGGAWPSPPLEFDFVLSNANAAGDGFSIRNSFVGFHRARGMLIKASDGVIENNTIANSTMGGIIITPELYWGEADYVHNLTVVNNTIVGVGAGRQGYGGIALGAFDPSNQPATGQGHRDVVIARNRVVDVGYAPVWLSSVAGLVFEGNSIESPFPVSPPWATCCENVPLGVAVWVTEASDAAFSGNCVISPGAYESGVFNVTASVQGEGLVDGVKIC